MKSLFCVNRARPLCVDSARPKSLSCVNRARGMRVQGAPGEIVFGSTQRLRGSTNLPRNSALLLSGLEFRDQGVGCGGQSVGYKV